MDAPRGPSDQAEAELRIKRKLPRCDVDCGLSLARQGLAGDALQNPNVERWMSGPNSPNCRPSIRRVSERANERTNRASGESQASEPLGFFFFEF